MRRLPAAQIEESDSRFEEFLALSEGRFRPCRVDVTVKGYTATRFHEWTAAGFSGLRGSDADQLATAAKMLFPSHPEHYAFPGSYSGVVETIGGLPTRMRLVVTEDLPSFVTTALDEAYPMKTPFRAEPEDGCQIILGVWWPTAAPDTYFDEHAEHFTVEYRRLLRIGAADA
ncbi:hypothetical protein AB0F77_10665 [Streptomyces sp. NPDC026672]|uniref:hypothetical protein n=1 Tax=unclassified Streptomyces TaxID=2593676 RepID=UPI0033E68731